VTLVEIFDALVADRKIALVLTDKQAAVVRVSLLRKWKDYKDQMGKLGFLDPELEPLVVSLELDKENTVATFFLREKKRTAVSYEVIAALPALEDTTNAP